MHRSSGSSQRGPVSAAPPDMESAVPTTHDTDDRSFSKQRSRSSSLAIKKRSCLSRFLRANETHFLLLIAVMALIIFRTSFNVMQNKSVDWTKNLVMFEQTPRLPDYTRAMSIHDNEAIKGWTKFAWEMDDITKQTQEMIYRHQNPPNCSDVKYLVWKNFDFGMGSDLHTLGWALGYAMAHDRVLIYHYQNWIYTEPTLCLGKQSPDCFFRPLSTCQNFVSSMEMMLALPWNPLKPNRFGNVMLTERIVRLECDLDHAITRTYIPPIPGFRERGISWWRAQTTRYIVVPNKSLQTWARAIMINDMQVYPRKPGWSVTNSKPPDQAICIHIRHGDKGKEMTLHGLGDYIAGADDLVKIYGAAPEIFMTTDDEHVINEIESGVYDYLGFTFYYIKYPRMNHLSPVKTAEVLGRTYFARVSLANLFLGVHPSCQWFVETTASNWNRLINEIRMTDGHRAGAPMVDLEVGEW